MQEGSTCFVHFSQNLGNRGFRVSVRCSRRCDPQVRRRIDKYTILPVIYMISVTLTIDTTYETNALPEFYEGTLGRFHGGRSAPGLKPPTAAENRPSIVGNQSLSDIRHIEL
jgi:hypothetical protein